MEHNYPTFPKQNIEVPSFEFSNKYDTWFLIFDFPFNSPGIHLSYSTQARYKEEHFEHRCFQYGWDSVKPVDVRRYDLLITNKNLKKISLRIQVKSLSYNPKTDVFYLDPRCFKDAGHGRYTAKDVDIIVVWTPFMIYQHGSFRRAFLIFPIEVLEERREINVYLHRNPSRRANGKIKMDSGEYFENWAVLDTKLESIIEEMYNKIFVK